MNNFIQNVKSQLREGLIRCDEESLRLYETDRTKQRGGDPLGVAFPISVQEVSRLLVLCKEANVSVVPSGGRTGLAAGAVASRGELILSLEKMDRIGEVDTMGRTVRVQAGAVTKKVQDHCQKKQLTWPVSFASEGSSQIGGNIATNAGGVHVIHYGSTRLWVRSLEVVTIDGRVWELGRSIEKDNTGYDLKQLFIGSEGTLGVITEATLKLAPYEPHREVFLFSLKDIASVVDFFQKTQSTYPLDVLAFEYFTKECLKVVESNGRKCPLKQLGGCFVILESKSPRLKSDREMLEDWLAGVLGDSLVLDGAMARSSEEAAEFWALRENISENLSMRGKVHKNDICVPLKTLSSFVEKLELKYAELYPNFERFLFGHIGDGNIHTNVLKPESMTENEFDRQCEDADRLLFEWVCQLGGSISAEHGIGLLKKKALAYRRNQDEVAVFSAIKRIFDPDGLMNPGKIFD